VIDYRCRLIFSFVRCSNTTNPSTWVLQTNTWNLN